MAEQLNNLMWEKCRRGRVEEVRQALAAGADPNALGGLNNSTCLMIATLVNQDQAIVELLLSTPGIQVNAKNKYDQTALHYACYTGSRAIIAMILSSPGVQLNERDNEGCTPIMWAIRIRQIQAVLLMAAVPQVCLDVKDNQGGSLEELANM